MVNKELSPFQPRVLYNLLQGHAMESEKSVAQHGRFYFVFNILDIIGDAITVKSAKERSFVI